MLKVYFTHDRKVYMHTAKCKDAIVTITVTDSISVCV